MRLVSIKLNEFRCWKTLPVAGKPPTRKDGEEWGKKIADGLAQYALNTEQSIQFSDGSVGSLYIETPESRFRQPCHPTNNPYRT